MDHRAQHVVMGATGHVGAAVVRALRARGESVIEVHHGTAGSSPGVVHADAHDVESLRAAFRCGRRAFLLNPPADVALDTDAVERATVANILAALEDSGLEKVVAASTGGAQPGERLGDLNVLWELEQGLARQSVPAAINRAAYYYSNWDGQIDSVRQTGELHTLFPADLPIPMVAPEDLGRAASERLVSPLDDQGVRAIEGPVRLTSRQVADIFGRVLGRKVTLVVTPRDQWEATFRSMGFSAAAAASYSRMTGVCVDQGFDPPDGARRWPTTFEEYLRTKVDQMARR
ncbi:MAG TPA: NmrA family NAD(P)-binding protein [Rhizobacter sp.]